MMNRGLEGIPSVSFIEVLREIGPVGYGILLILLGFSTFSWAIILYKYRKLRQMRKESEKFLELYYENKLIRSFSQFKTNNWYYHKYIFNIRNDSGVINSRLKIIGPNEDHY